MSNPTDRPFNPAADYLADLGDESGHDHSPTAGGAAVLLPVLEDIARTLKRIADLMEDRAP